MLVGYRKGGAGYVLIKVHSLYDNSSGIVGLDGKELQIDTTSAYEDRKKRTRISGEVIQLPFYMGNKPMYQIPVGTPSYGAIRDVEGEMDEPHPALYSIGGFFDYKMMSDIAQEVQLGDRIYFPWRILNSPNNMIAHTASKHAKKALTWIFKVGYDSIYCAVRNEKIIMIGGYVLIDPIFETWDEILRPTYYPFKNALGEFEVRPKKEWLQVKVAPSKKDRQGIVAHVGTPLRGERCNLKVGDKVLFKPNLKSLIKIEDKNYIVMRQEHVVCKVHEYGEPSVQPFSISAPQG